MIYSNIRTAVAILFLSLMAAPSGAEDDRIAFSTKLVISMPEGEGAPRNSEGIFEYPEGTVLLAKISEIKLSEEGEAPTNKQALDGDVPDENLIGEVEFTGKFMGTIGAGSIFFFDEFDICFVDVQLIERQFICEYQAGDSDVVVNDNATFWRWTSKNIADTVEAINYSLANGDSTNGDLLKFIALIPNQEADKFIEAVEKAGVVEATLIENARDIRGQLKGLVHFEGD